MRHFAILALLIGCKSPPALPPIPQRVTKSLAIEAAPTLAIVNPQAQPPPIFTAYWPTAETNWVPEWSTNMVDWNATTQTMVYTTGPAGIPWTGNFFVRLKRLP